MNSFILYFKRSPAFFIALGFFLLFEISLGLLNNLYLIDGRGTFLTVYKRKIAEDPAQSFNVLMFGDSRSLSVNGRKDADGFSMYNFSLPAAGPDYIRYFLAKYLKYHKKPDVVIWAVEPTQLIKKKSALADVNPEVWKNFRHRLLNLFSLSENLEQYEGKDKFFILKETIPLLLPSVEHREGLEKIISGSRLADFKKMKIGNLPSNLELKVAVDQKLGQVNVGNYFEVPDPYKKNVNEKMYADQQKERMNESYDLSPLTKFLETAGKEGIPVVILEIPSASDLIRSPANRKLTAEFRKMALKKNVYYLQFPDMEYKLDYFAEAIHYNREGEARVNSEFEKSVWPAIRKIVKNEK